MGIRTVPSVHHHPAAAGLQVICQMMRRRASWGRLAARQTPLRIGGPWRGGWRRGTRVGMAVGVGMAAGVGMAPGEWA